MKIIINIEDNIPEKTAVSCVMGVINRGRISCDTKGRPFYCWVTEFETAIGRVEVQTRRDLKNTSFIVKKTI